MSTNILTTVVDSFHSGAPEGIASVCSAHPWVIEAALRFAKTRDQVALIEATCNQVNQEGGYTGMTPMGFRNFVKEIAASVDFPFDRIIFGGDHLGPNPWKHLPADQAMEKARQMIIAYAQAGFQKLHLDTSMGCYNEAAALEDETTAHRAAQLAYTVEALELTQKPKYIIGTEVPVPGGATHALDDIEPTSTKAVTKTIDVHRHAFQAKGIERAFERVIGVVVQPGVEFGHTDVIQFDPQRAAMLTAHLRGYPNLVYEAHSTDYQTPENLRALIEGGFCILKVGPWLSFGLRQALYRLDHIADILDGKSPQNDLANAMDKLMCAEPENWEKYYGGTLQEQKILRHYSLSDRIRYYWPHPKAQAAVTNLLTRLEHRAIPKPLLEQYDFSPKLLGPCPSAKDIALCEIEKILEGYNPTPPFA